MTDIRKIKAGFVGFGEVNTPREFIDKRCAAVASLLESNGIDLLTTAPVSDIPDGSDSERAARELGAGDFDFLVVCIAGWIPSWAVFRVIEPFKHKPILLLGLTGWQEGGRFVTTADQAGTTALRKPMEDMGYRFRYLVAFRGEPVPIEPILAFARAARAASLLRNARIGMAGYRDMRLYGTLYDGISLKAVTGVEIDHDGARSVISAPIVCLCAGAVMSAALLLASATFENPAGLANASDQVGRNFMNHNLTGMVAYNPLRRNRSVYEKTLQINDWYLTGGPQGEPLGNIQMLGRITGPILAGEAGLPLWLARHVADRSIHIMAMSEDLPDPASRVLWQNGGVVLDWRRTNTAAHDLLVQNLTRAMRRAGWPIVLSRGFPKSKPSHQCGTARMGADPATSVVDANLRAHDLENLFIVDASVLPTSAAVNPSLTIAALALRAADHIAGIAA